MSRMNRYYGEETHGIPTIRTFGWVGYAINALTEELVAGASELRRHTQTGQSAPPPRQRRTAQARPAPTGTSSRGQQARRRRPVWKILARVAGALAALAWLAICYAARYTVLAARCLTYAGQRQLARARCNSDSVSERQFGRESLVHCASILRRRKNRLLAPATRAARRLVRDARRAAEREVAAERMTEGEAARWLAAFASSVEVRLESLDAPRRVKRVGLSRRVEGDERETTAVVEHRVPPPRARVEQPLVAVDEEPPPVEIRPARRDSAPTPPSGITIREDDDPEAEEEVLNYLEEERHARRHEPDSAFAHDGD